MSDKELISALIVIIASLLAPKDRDNYEWVDLIDRWVRSEQGRHALKRLMIDNVTVERISEEIDRSPRHTARIISKAKTELFKHVS